MNTWTQAFCGGLNTCTPAPQIDLAAYTILAVFLGMKPSGGYNLNITQVNREDSTIAVTILVTVPGPSCYVTLGIIYPYQILQIPKTLEPVDFEINTVIRNC